VASVENPPAAYMLFEKHLENPFASFAANGMGVNAVFGAIAYPSAKRCCNFMHQTVAVMTICCGFLFEEPVVDLLLIE
jgi:hypothetical protein